MPEDARALRSPDPTTVVRPVRLSDVEALQRCWPERGRSSLSRLVSRAQYLARSEYGIGLVALLAQEVVGYGQLTLWPRCGEISDLVVAERVRGQGIGTAIIQHLVRYGRRMNTPYIEIGAALDNPRALRLYRRLGFVDYRVVSLNLGQGDVAVLYLRLDLPGSA